MSKTKNVGRFLSLILRHQPEKINLKLDENGWAIVAELQEKLAIKFGEVSLEMLQEIVATNNKKRFSFNEDETKIRANQGHSIKVDVELKEQVPPTILYHGTASRFVEAILKEGLKSQSRLHVHLTDNLETAVNVGNRHGKVVVFDIDTSKMLADGHTFYLSENLVWLCDHVPSQFLSVKE